MIERTLTIVRVLVLMLLSLGLGACASHGGVGPGRAELAGFALQLEHEWSFIPGRTNRDIRVSQLTRYGPRLDRVFLISNLQDGQAMLDLGFERAPQYQSWMGAHQLERFLQQSLDALGYRQIEVTAQAVGGQSDEATRYRIIAEDAGGLAVEGFALARTGDYGLNLMIFMAARMHYFALLEEEVFDLMVSAEPLFTR